MRFFPKPLLVLFFCAAFGAQALASPPHFEESETDEALQADDAKSANPQLSPLPLEGASTCVLAKTLLGNKQETRALLYFERCWRSTGESEARKEVTRLRRRFQGKKLAPVSLSLSPENARASIDSAYSPDDTLLTDEDLWLAKGNYRIEVRAEGYEAAAFAIVVDSRDRMLVPLSLRKELGVKDTEIDLGEDAGSELGSVSTAADPRPKKFKTILPKRYKQAPDPSLVPDNSDQSPSKAWPWITTTAGVALVGAGIALHVNDKTTPALVSYGVGGSLLGLATYLFLREDEEQSTPSNRVSISVSPTAWTYGLSGSW